MRRRYRKIIVDERGAARRESGLLDAFFVALGCVTFVLLGALFVYALIKSHR